MDELTQNLFEKLMVTVIEIAMISAVLLAFMQLIQCSIAESDGRTVRQAFMVDRCDKRCAPGQSFKTTETQSFKTTETQCLCGESAEE